MNIETSLFVNDLNSLIRQFKFKEALEKYYDENILTSENESPPVSGLEAYKKNLEVFIENVSNYSAKLLSVLISDGITVTEWHYKFQHKLWGNWDKVQVSVQRWKNGKIIQERHYYN